MNMTEKEFLALKRIFATDLGEKMSKAEQEAHQQDVQIVRDFIQKNDAFATEVDKEKLTKDE